MKPQGYVTQPVHAKVKRELRSYKAENKRLKEQLEEANQTIVGLKDSQKQLLCNLVDANQEAEEIEDQLERWKSLAINLIDGMDWEQSE